MSTSAHTARGEVTATVRANVPLCREHFRLTLEVPRFAPTRAGQFVQIGTRAVVDERDPIEHQWLPGTPLRLSEPDLLHRETVLRRPFSLAGRRDTAHGVELDVIHRVVGVGTAWLSELAVGEAVSVLGPLGNGFPLPAPGSTALLVGGGVGIPPMIYLAQMLAGTPAVAFAGATTSALLPLQVVAPTDTRPVPTPCLAEFARHQIPAIVATDDGSLGQRGFVTQALQAFLDLNPSHRFTLYTCGPEPMMRRVAGLAAERNLPCHVAIERAMACGMGTCQSCCIKVKKPDPCGSSPARPRLGLAAGVHGRPGVPGGNAALVIRRGYPIY